MANKSRPKSYLDIQIDPKGRVSITAYLSGKLFKEGRKWVSYCPSLDLATCGATKAEAMENTKEAIQLFFESCLERGTLKDALKELKWKKIDQVIQPKALSRLSSEIPPAFMVDQVFQDNQWSGHVKF